ncbi:hypothetical protein [Thiolapillus brandeum]|nr:hypothetical protein [Thiolapillus brandeum]
MQRINSERTLQASMWAKLNDRLGKNRRLFIEPSLKVREGGKLKVVFPDIVVCNSRQVISVIELKYLPRVKANYKKDINTLNLIASNRAGVSIANERFRGPQTDSRKYSLSKSIIFVWAGVHATVTDDEGYLFSEGHENLRGCYMQLHASTHKNRGPDVYYYE